MKSKGKRSLADKSFIGLHPTYWAEDFNIEPAFDHRLDDSHIDEANDFLELEIQNLNAYIGIKGDYIDHGH